MSDEKKSSAAAVIASGRILSSLVDRNTLTQEQMRDHGRDLQRQLSQIIDEECGSRISDRVKVALTILAGAAFALITASSEIGRWALEVRAVHALEQLARAAGH